MSAWSDEDAVLAKFREWLEEAHTEGDRWQSEDDFAGEDSELRLVGLSQLVEQFTALRHELKLQTKSARQLDERTETTIKELQVAIDAFRTVEPRESRAAEQAAKPLIEAVVQLYDAVERGGTALANARDRLLEESGRQLQQELEALLARQPRWRRGLCRPWHQQVKQLCLQKADTVRDILDSTLEGYRLIQSRLQRVLDQQRVTRLQCLGRPADPLSMTVVEIVDDPSRPPGTVVEEIRPGYLWKDKVLRFAEVRAVKGSQ